ncbi:MAG TPA: sulfite exporter TauE/SafE family protein [Burkholderiales bacterium]|nr:sulfite exporter TauE/SafE family protein [Burkholderiales bacterium]
MGADHFILGAIAFLGALIFGITGFGSALVTIPLATHLVPLQFALALFAVVDLCCALSVGLENPKNAVRAEWTRLVPMILVGTVLGVTLLVNLPRATGMLLLGIFIVSYAVYTLLRRGGAKVIKPAWAWVAGLCGGITSTLFGAGGPPYAIYLSSRGLTKEQFRATMGFATMTSIGLRVTAFLVTGLLLDKEVWLAILVAVPAALLALFFAKKLFHRISRDILMRAVALLLLVSGGALVLRAIN